MDSLLRTLLRAWAVMLVLSSSLLMAQAPGPAAEFQKEVPMAADATPSFEVATIHPSDPSDPRAAQGWSFESEGHLIRCKQATLLDLLMVMYELQPRQVVGGPAWLSKDRYDISGVPDVPGEPNPTQFREMFKKLLAERFHLVLHRETREMPIYAVTVAKGGPLLKPTKPGEPVNTGNSGDSTQRTLRFTNMSMKEFTNNMDIYEDRPVVDRTGLPGRYDFTLKWTYELSAEGQPGAPPSLFTAMKEQLGLKMEAVKGAAEVVVIDRLEKPTEN